MLAGRRILLVEDEFVIAAMAEDMLRELGATIVGPASNVARALDLAEREAIDVALLDVNMRGERIDPVAETLRRRKIPMVFATGYGEVPIVRGSEAQVLPKPYTQQQLAGVLQRALESPT